ncbi:MAG: DUF309 domain-containing protein, partial [Planctomycetes bacterium]|nr:DUF309 domain-containing protein [Planctomycetota bacterium]
KDFFECHEFLEEIWRHSSHQHARFYQGLIQAAVCFYHWGNANFDGAMRLAKAAKDKLADLPRDFMELELGAFMDRFVPMVEPLFGDHGKLKPLPASQAPTLGHAWKMPEQDPLLEDAPYQ